MNTFDDVVILGAGLSGLGCARQLPGARVFEAKPHVGGHAWSHSAGGFHFDEGAHICHSRDEAYLKLVTESAAGVNRVARSQVVNWRKGAWLTYPVQNHLHELPLAERTSALCDFVTAQVEGGKTPPENYHQWCLAQYGKFLTDNFYQLYTAKYWRTPMDQLATDWLSGRLLPSQINRVVAGALGAQADDQAVFAAFLYPNRGGYFSFYRELYNGLDIRLNHRAAVIDLEARSITFGDGKTQNYEHLFTSISLPQLIGIVKDPPASVRDAAALLRHTQLLCVNIVVGRPQLTPVHWFYIYDHDIEASRVSVASNLGQELAASTATALQAEIFRLPSEDMPEEKLVENTIEKLMQVLRFSRDEIVSVKTVRVPHAYIISDLNRARAAQHVQEWLISRNVNPIGMLGKWKFLWSDASFRDGVQAGQLLAQTRP